MRSFKRSQRLEVQIRRDISGILDQALGENWPGLVTVTHVRMTNDLRQAKVYYSFLGSDDDKQTIEEYLVRERGKLRSMLGKGLHIRHIPELEFKFDPSVKEGIHIETLLNKIEKERGDHDA